MKLKRLLLAVVLLSLSIPSLVLGQRRAYDGDAAWQRMTQAYFADAAEARQAPNTGMGAWYGRVTYDAAAVGIDVSVQKHRNEWRAAMGLGPLPIVVAPPGRLHVQGRDFATADGKVEQYRGITSFRLYQRFLAREPLDRMLDDYLLAAGPGATLRVLGMFGWDDTPFWPQRHADYFERLPEFLAWVGSHGLRVEFTVFADAQVVMPSLGEQRAHEARVQAVLRAAPNAFEELVNEYGKNGVDPSKFPCASGVLMSRGSGAGEESWPQPPCDYNVWHGRRDMPKAIYDDVWWLFDNAPGGNRPLLHDEPIGFSNNNVPGRRLNTPADAFALGALSGAFLTGATFHSDGDGDGNGGGIDAQPWSPTVKACAEAFFRGFGLMARDR